jgi:adenosylmethionine-8-amino-7-oxononanoate aminotransferase
MSLVDRDRARIWHPYTQMRIQAPLLPVVRGEGVYLFTEDGRRILDGISSWWVNIHGHSHPRLNRALTEQAERLEHVLFAGCTHPPAVELAERLVAAVPPGLTRVFYSDNGSTAVEVAVKMALQYWANQGQRQRTVFVGLDHAYHGDTVGAMSVSAQSLFTEPFAPLLFKAVRAGDLDSLEAELTRRGDAVAGVIVEPMLQGAGGMIVWPPGFLAGVRRLCDRSGALLIADEVLTGFGRTGRMFACEHAGISPDLICLSKALTAGYLPLGATVVTDAVFEAFLSADHGKTFFHGHSYTANPLACAVAIESLRLFEEDSVLDGVRRIEAQLASGLSRFRELPAVADVRHIGAVGVVELGRTQGPPLQQAQGPPLQSDYLDQIGPRLAAAFVERGILLRPLGNVVYFMPPYVISASEVEWVLSEMYDVIGTVTR